MSAPHTSAPGLNPPAPPGMQAAWVVIAAGVCAALHVGKLAPAIPALQGGLGLTLVQAGFLLSVVQGAGMALGLLLGAWADSLGGRRSMALGLLLVGGSSLAGGAAQGPTATTWLLASRVLEGLGFLMVVLPAPGLVRALVPPARTAAMLGVWGAYMPLATALALLLGPLALVASGWRAWWWALGALSLLMAALLWRSVPQRLPQAAAPGPAAPWWQRVRLTLARPGPWGVALCFAAYSAQWLAVVGFLPTLLTKAGVGAALTGVLSAFVAAANIGGNLTAGRLLQRGVGAGWLLGAGFAAMALGALAAFGTTAEGARLPLALAYGALLVFSGGGGLIPATLFSLALRAAPGPQTVASTVGWMQQWSALGQFGGPPLVAAVASAVGGWQFTGWATGAMALAGALCAAWLMRQLPR
ncbi:MFS transporter [Rubrivivax rivuli]|uniref:MFS transporter n=1 Tax=Rubrivivax rivuli TaxID=1862385 RepID=A0A437RRB5_9BURK|nr:MFS transporter [Rubrivivax rivuli]RVU49327.1 MFS transporter [Rubrivivax rivuli]